MVINPANMQVIKRGGNPLSDDDPLKGSNTAAEGTGTDVSRADHVHPDLSRDPDYDSGWFALGSGSTSRTHNLGTNNLLVQVLGNETGGYQIMNMRIGGIGGGSGWRGGSYRNLNSTSIIVQRESGDNLWDQWRIQLWKLK